MSARIKIVLYGILSIVLSLLVGYLVVTPLMANAEKNQYIQEVKGQFELYNNNVEVFRADMIYAITLLQQADEIYTDSSEYTNYLTAFDDGFNYNPTSEEQTIILSMFDFALANSHVDSIYIGYEETGAFVRTGPIQSSHPAGEGFNYDPRERSWYVNAKEAPDEFVFNDIDKHPTQEIYFSTLSTTLYDENNEFIGVLGIDIVFDHYMDNFKQVENLSRGQFIYLQSTKAVIHDEDGSIEITTLDELYTGLDFVSDITGFNAQDVSTSDGEYLVVTYPVEGTSVRFIHVIEQSAIQAIIFTKIAAIRNLFIIVTLFLILTMLVVMNFIIIKPLGSITEQIRDYRKRNIESYYRFSEEGSKEFVQIARVLNEMVDTINEDMIQNENLIKELNTLNAVTDLAYRMNYLEDILQGTAEAIVNGMQFPEDTAVHIVFKDRHFYSREFEPTEWLLTIELSNLDKAQGAINVYYLEEKPEIDIGPFKKSELDLLINIKTSLSTALQYRKFKENK